NGVSWSRHGNGFVIPSEARNLHFGRQKLQVPVLSGWQILKGRVCSVTASARAACRSARQRAKRLQCRQPLAAQRQRFQHAFGGNIALQLILREGTAAQSADSGV